MAKLLAPDSTPLNVVPLLLPPVVKLASNITDPDPVNDPKVEVELTSNVPEAPTSTLVVVERAPVELSANVPAETVVVPVKVFDPVKVSVLVPTLVSDPAPEISPLKVVD